MRIETQMFGEVEVNPEKVYTFSEGLIGFEDQTSFILIEADELKPLTWLVSTSEPEISFPMADARYFVENYEVGITGEDRAALDVEKGDEVAIYVIVSLPDEKDPLSANLRGPVVVNLSSRLGRQIVLRDDRYAYRQVALAETARAAAS